MPIALGFQTISSNSNNNNPTCKAEGSALPVASNARGNANASLSRTKLFESTPGSNHDSNFDDQARRQLLFTMLYGGAAAALGGPPEQAEAAESAVEATAATTATTIAPPISTTILRPPKDDRDYLSYTLDNGLRVLLCSDPSSAEAAAAMDVHVGACSDPVEVPGMAHFCEHMSFLGSKPYPTEEAFSKFLAANGGMSNAYTDSEDTVYYFNMEAETDGRLAEGFAIFGSLFASPLFTESATGRELNAIESENSKNLQNDSFRLYQLMKSRANSDHPYSKFFTGNKKTLLDDTKANNINLREELIKFHGKYYSANQMTLAVVAPQSVSKLKEMVQKSFASIPNKDVPKPETTWAGQVPPYGGASVVPSYQHMVEVVPVQDLRQVTLSWPVIYENADAAQEAVLRKQSNYVAHLVGHEGPNSLLSYLKRKRWASSVSCGTEAELADFEALEVTVGLTTLGLANLNKVIEAIFTTITMLRERPIPDYLFQEVLQTNELEWRFATKGSAGSYVQSLVAAMQKYPPELYVAGPRRLGLLEGSDEVLATSEPRSRFSAGALQATKESVQKFVSNLTVDKVMITVLSKSFEGKTDQREKWYGTNYNVKPVPIDTLMQWQNCPSPKALKIDYPRPNVFIPSDAGLRVKIEPEKKPRAKDFESRIKPVPLPTIIRDDGPAGRWTLDYKADDRFGLPKAFVVFELLTSEVSGTPYKAALSTFYDACIVDKLGEYAYDAGLAGLTYDVKVLPRGVRLTFGGFDDKLPQFAAYVSQKISKDLKSILPTDEQEFDRYKDQIRRALSAFDAKQPYAHAAYYANLNIQPRRFQYTNQQMREATEKATLQDLIAYSSTVWSSGKGKALIQGNLDEQEAQSLVNQLDKTLGFKTIPESEIPAQLKPLRLPTPPNYTAGSKPSSLKRTRLVVAEPNPVESNAASYVLVQSLGETAKDHVLIELISAIIEQPFYDDLRTKQQLGYIVSSGVRGLGKTRTLAFIVQSSVAPVEKLSTETLKFMDNIRNRIDKLPPVDLGTFVKGLIDRKLEPDKTLATEVMRNWAEINSDRREFDRVQQEALALLEIKKPDLLEFWDRVYTGEESRVLITQIVPRDGPASSPAPPKSFGYNGQTPSEGLVLGEDDLEAFRRDLEEGVVEAQVA